MAERSFLNVSRLFLNRAQGLGSHPPEEHQALVFATITGVLQRPGGPQALRPYNTQGDGFADFSRKPQDVGGGSPHHSNCPGVG